MKTKHIIRLSDGAVVRSVSGDELTEAEKAFTHLPQASALMDPTCQEYDAKRCMIRRKAPPKRENDPRDLLWELVQWKIKAEARIKALEDDQLKRQKP